MEDDMNVIKSLIAISKGGLAVSEIPAQFREINGTYLNYIKYGFRSLEEMLQSSKEISVRPSSGGLICVVNDAKMSHVASLVSRTRGPSRRKPNRSKPKSYNPPRGYYSPQRRFGVRRGSFGESSRRQPFYPANRMQCDSGEFRRNTASSRPPPKLPNASASTRYQFNSSSSTSQFRQNTASSQPPAKLPNASASSRSQFNSSSSTSHRYVCNSNVEMSKRNEPKPVQSNYIGSTVSKRPLKTKSVVTSSSDWSSDEQPSTHLSSTNWTTRSTEAKTLAEVKPLKSSASSSNASKAQAVSEANSGLAETQDTSDWSDSDSASSGVIEVARRTVMPLVQNGDVSSTSKLKTNVLLNTNRSGKPQLKTKSASNSDWSDEPSEEFESLLISPPLMIGGVGRGKSRLQVDLVKPGMNEAKILPASSQEITVSGSPSKRESTMTRKCGRPTIIVQIQNKPAIQIQRPKDVVMSLPKTTVANYEFIGDFLLRRVAEVSLGMKCPVGGLCRDHITILECAREIQMKRSPRPIVLMIGMTDILRGATFEELEERISLLLQKLSGRNLVLLTLPVIPSFFQIGWERKLTILEKYNRLLLNKSPGITIETEKHLYCDAPFYTRLPKRDVETFSEAGCWVIFDEIIGASL